jgi:hypothetical protein
VNAHQKDKFQDLIFGSQDIERHYDSASMYSTAQLVDGRSSSMKSSTQNAWAKVQRPQLHRRGSQYQYILIWWGIRNILLADEA